MTEIEIPFSDQDKEDLEIFRGLLDSVDPDHEDKKRKHESTVENVPKRHIVTLPRIEASTEEIEKGIEKAFTEGTPSERGAHIQLPKDLVEGAKAAFVASGGNISHVAAMYDLTPEAVLRLAASEDWPVYGGATTLQESKSKAQLTSLRDRLWHRIEIMLDAMEVEKKTKADIVQYRINSEYVEPLASRSSAFKVLMDQYMRVATILEPEIFGDDPDPSNYHAKSLKDKNYPGGVEGVNREMADFFSQVVVGIADRIKDRELQGYGQIIDARVE
jgi:hypothetical protein